ncbi:hypothetical protein DRJ00_09200 [Candidatus Aerophobetes bacterium]|uniref:Uncharacterized protein n=1 Tax=Aerophobetes bacterium TaxID=2030807 RepID=A0A497E244_UNCAE|nr:MAG: hypothetical protein DRJ00_09200 [Candidatus Aerophobetes bacterium]
MKRFAFFLTVVIFVGGLFAGPNNVAGKDEEYTIIRITNDNYFEEWPSIDDDGNNIAFGRRNLNANFYDIVKKNLITGQEVVLFKSKSIKDPNIRFFSAKEPVISGNGEFVAYLIETYTGNLIGINEKIFELDASMLDYPADCTLRVNGPLDVSYEGVVLAPVNVVSKTPMLVNWGYLGKQPINDFTVLARITSDGKASLIYGPSLYKKSNYYEINWEDGPRLDYDPGWPQTYSLGEGKLVFPGYDKNGDLGLYLYFPDTATVNKIVSSNVFSRAAQISRNGQRIFFVANLGTNLQLAYIDIKTGKVSEITSRRFGKIFTSNVVPHIRSFYRYADPTGSKVVFGIYSNRTLKSLYIMNIDGTEEKEIVTVGKSGAPNIIDWYGGKYIANSGRAIILKGRNSYFNDGGDLYLFKLGEAVQTGATFPPAEKSSEEEKRIMEEPLGSAQIISLIRACQESVSEQSEMIRQIKKEIELLKTRIDQLEERIEELGKKEPIYKSILDLSQADEPWAREWKILSTVKELPGGGKAGFYSEAVKIGAAHPNPGRRGILYLHPPTQEEPVRIARKVTVTGSKPSLKMGVSGNRDVDGDWALTVKVNGQPLEKEKIIAGTKGWQDLSFDLTAFSGQTVDIQIEARANNWYFEFVFFDYIQIEEGTLAPSDYKELPREVTSFQGVWDTSWGEMRLTQSGANVTGTYIHQDGKIKGTVRGNILTGKWSEAPSYSEPHDAGDVELELSEDGNSFSGRWRYGSSGEWDGVWTGTRIDKS